ncbi:hypothetical protein ACFQ49_11305 [Kroppenstedtia eburnea]|uniref:hypothetical protein n=1 Tax=Kroppenstedtia eburnea TaxID=714067 RepID=UPI00362F3D7D
MPQRIATGFFPLSGTFYHSPNTLTLPESSVYLRRLSFFLSFPLLCGVSSSFFFLVSSLHPSFAASLRVRNSDQDQPDPEPGS